MRDYHEYDTLLAAVAESKFEITEVVSGGASGVDALGERYAKENGIPLRIFPADWAKHGNAAGPIRNKEMANYADALIALWDGLSRGTGSMVGYARLKNLKYYIKPIAPDK